MLFAMAGGAILLLASCAKVDLQEEQDLSFEAGIEGRCAADAVLKRQISEDPERLKRLEEFDRFAEEYTKNRTRYRLAADGYIEIPVVVNVLYRTASENVSQARIDAQLAVLNADFAAANSDFNKVPADFTSVAGGAKIRFVPAGVVRKATNKTSWRTNDDMKKSTKGGINPTNPAENLNIWVCTLSNGILGYAQFPGGPASTDGVVILGSAFGTSATGATAAPYNEGRTATHEVGHYLNLRHIWGDATCGTDFVDDTPTHNTANYGCPAAGHKSTCTGTPVEMTMNYMDYTDDKCMYMFTKLQVSRMMSVFAAGKPRASMGD